MSRRFQRKKALTNGKEQKFASIGSFSDVQSSIFFAKLSPGSFSKDLRNFLVYFVLQKCEMAGL